MLEKAIRERFDGLPEHYQNELLYRHNSACEECLAQGELCEQCEEELRELAAQLNYIYYGR